MSEWIEDSDLEIPFNAIMGEVGEKELHNVLEKLKTIASQIGNRAFAMMGASNLMTSGSGLSFKVGRNPKGVTHVKVTLDPSDTYTVEFLRCSLRAKNIRKVLGTFDDVYAEDLRELIESETGLALSL